MAYLGAEVLRGVAASSTPLSLAPRLDDRALLFTLAATLATGLVAGVLPALRARQLDLHASVADGGRGGTSAARRRTQTVLVIAEVALTVALLTSAGLLLRSLANVSSSDPGFDPERVLAFEVSLPDATYASPEKRFVFAWSGRAPASAARRDRCRQRYGRSLQRWRLRRILPAPGRG